MRYGPIGPCLLALALSGCGSGSVCFSGDCGGNDDDKDRTVTVEGNLDSVRPPNSVRDIVVFVYTKLDPDDLADGPPFTTYEYAESVVVKDDDTFEMSRIARGKLTVMLLLDDPDPDGSIDSCSPDLSCDECEAGTCDEYSVLRDGGDLSDVPGGRDVTIKDMDVDFAETSCPDPPPAAGAGCSRADEILISRPAPTDGKQLGATEDREVEVRAGYSAGGTTALNARAAVPTTTARIHAAQKNTGIRLTALTALAAK